jgi:hypothetical protein
MLSDEEQRRNPGWPADHAGHIWSGWPGAYCFRCGAEHALELAVADGWYDPAADAWDSEEHRRQVEQADGHCPADAGRAGQGEEG